MRHLGQFGRAIDRDAAFEHRHVMAGMAPCESEIGPPGGLEGGQSRGLALLVGMFHQLGEDLVALARRFGDQVLAALEMAVDGGRGDPGLLGRLREGKAAVGPLASISTSAVSTRAWRRLPWW
jgi:hypothetical protein